MRDKENPGRQRRPSEYDALRGLGDRFPIPPFRVRERKLDPSPRNRRIGAPDAVIDLEWEGQTQRFAVEYKSLGTPRLIDLALLQVRRYARENPDVAPLIVAPYLRTELLERLIKEQVSAIDLSGNYAVVVPGRWLVIRTGAGNKYRSSAPIKNIYRGKSALVSRALMLKGTIESATALMNELTGFGPVSLPTISKVLKTLEEELIIDRSEAIKVVQPERLLENLVANYRAPEIRRELRGKIGFTPALAMQLNKNASTGGVPYAADSPGQYTVLPSSDQVTRIYTSSIEKLLRGIPIADSRFPDVELLETADLAVFHGRVQRGDLFSTSPLQVYLQLVTGEKREKQAAGQMLADLLAFRFR